MGVEVYADLYVLINAGMDLICLSITAALLHRCLPRWRGILGAAVGGIYALASLLLNLEGIPGLLSDILAASAITVLVFWERKMRFGSFLRTVAVFLLSSVLLGGIMTVLFEALNRLNLPLNSLQGDGLSVWLFAAVATVSGLLTRRGGRALRRAENTEQVTLLVMVDGKSARLSARVDSGNLLRDPISGKSVVAVNRRILEPLLPNGFLEHWQTRRDYARRARLIPTKTATGEGMLVAILPDSLKVITNGRETEIDCLVAAAELDGAGGFDALLPAD
jgi:stage II sporulation protein GA (sporulation sigma-E factor processing peptidase)